MFIQPAFRSEVEKVSWVIIANCAYLRVGRWSSDRAVRTDLNKAALKILFRQTAVGRNDAAIEKSIKNLSINSQLGNFVLHLWENSNNPK